LKIFGNLFQKSNKLKGRFGEFILNDKSIHFNKQLSVTLRRLDTKNYPFGYTSKKDDNFTIA
jgi:hypothetical protein